MMKLLRIVVVCLVMQGCALTDAELDVEHDATKVSQGPLSEVDPKMFVLNDFRDARADTARIGYKKNGFGQNMGDIATLKPVPQVIADAVDSALVANGHTIGNAGVVVDGIINQFWVDLDVNFTNLEMSCNIEAQLQFTDMATNSQIHSATYTGSYSDKKQLGTESNYEEIIEGALQTLIDAIVFDEDLAEALGGF